MIIIITRRDFAKTPTIPWSYNTIMKHTMDPDRIRKWRVSSTARLVGASIKLSERVSDTVAKPERSSSNVEAWLLKKPSGNKSGCDFGYA